MSEDLTSEIKIIILGSVGVGKTCLITRYKTGKFLQHIPSTFGSNFVKIDKIINNKKYVLNIWDTAGQEKYNSLTQTFTKNAKIVILVYSIIDKKSFLDLDNWLKLVKEENGDKGYVLGVAANKWDLYLQSEVSDKKGKEYAKKINAIWKSTSAKEESKGIEELISELTMEYIKIEESGGNIRTESIRLDKNMASKDKKGGCCGGGKKKEKNKITTENKGSVVSKDDEDKEEEEDED
jgi:small GTP-binding protein